MERTNGPHIVIVTDNGHVNGGSGKVALTSARMLANAGFRVTVFCAVGPVDTDLLQHANLDVICLQQHDILTNPSRAAAFVQGLWNAEAKRQFDRLLCSLDRERTIIHVHSWTKALSSSVIAAGVDRKFKIVLTLHDYFSVCPIGSLYNHKTQTKCHLQPMSRACITENCDSRSYAQKLWRVARQLIQGTLGKLPGSIRHYISISDFSKVIVKRRMRTADAEFYDVANPVDVQRQTPARPELNSRFVFVGRLSLEKGPILFAQAAKNSGLPAAFVGTGECDAAILAANPAAQLLGWLTASDSIAAIRDSRALVFPSLWFETLGLTVQEALASGVPAIVPSDSAAADEIIDGETGLIFESGDAISLERCLRRLAEDDDLVRRLGRNAFERYWSAPLSESKHMSGLIKTYAAVLPRESVNA